MRGPVPRLRFPAATFLYGRLTRCIASGNEGRDSVRLCEIVIGYLWRGRAWPSSGRRSRNQTGRASRKDSRQKNWRQKNGEKISSRSQSNFWSRQVKLFPFFCLQFFCLKSSRK